MYTNAHSLHGIYDNGLSGIGLNSTIGYGGLDGNEALTASYLYSEYYECDLYQKIHSPEVWYFSAWNFQTRYIKLDSPLGINAQNLNYFFWYCVIEESRASEVVKTRSL